MISTPGATPLLAAASPPLLLGAAGLLLAPPPSIALQQALPGPLKAPPLAPPPIFGVAGAGGVPVVASRQVSRCLLIRGDGIEAVQIGHVAYRGESGVGLGLVPSDGRFLFDMQGLLGVKAREKLSCVCRPRLRCEYL